MLIFLSVYIITFFSPTWPFFDPFYTTHHFPVHQTVQESTSHILSCRGVFNSCKDVSTSIPLFMPHHSTYNRQYTGEVIISNAASTPWCAIANKKQVLNRVLDSSCTVNCSWSLTKAGSIISRLALHFHQSHTFKYWWYCQLFLSLSLCSSITEEN